MKQRRALMMLLALGFGQLVNIHRAGAAESEKIKLRVAVLTPEGTWYTDVMKQSFNSVRQATQGRVDFVLYTAGVAGTETELIEKIRRGELDVAGVTDIALGNVMPELRLLNLPDFTSSHQESAYLMSQMSEDVAARFEAQGFVLLGWNPLGPGYLFTKKRIERVVDLRGQKVWLYPDDKIGRLLAEEVGVVEVVPLPWPDVRPALEEGRLDVVYNVPVGMIAFQWYPFVRYAVETPITMVGSGTVMSAAVWKRIASRDREAIREVVRRRIQELTDRARDDNAAAVRGLKKNGVKFLPLSEEGMREFRDLSLRVRTRLEGDSFSKEFLSRAERLLSEYRSAPPAK